ncbi:MAG: exodeoxyribonuclease III [Deinococcales bacterium]
MRIVSFNVNGIRAAYNKGAWDYLKSLAPDYVCLQEVRADEGQNPLTSLEDYHHQWLAAEKKGYSGVGILSQERPCEICRGIRHPEWDKEGRVLRADFESFSLISVYIPSGSSGDPRQVAKMDFLAHFYRYVQDLIKEKRDYVICGDMNIAHQPIDLTNWKSNQKNSGFLPEERQWFSEFLALGLVDVSRQLLGNEAMYSWWSLRSGARARNIGWRLDYQFATPHIAQKARVLEIPREPIFSDHAPVLIEYL